MPSSHKKSSYTHDDATRHRTLFVTATLLVAAICTFTPRGIFRDYDAKERSKQVENVRDLDTKKWQRDQENQYHQERRSRSRQTEEDDYEMPPRRASYRHSSRDGRTMDPPPQRARKTDREMDDSVSPRSHRRSRHQEQSPKKNEPDPFSWGAIIDGLG